MPEITLDVTHRLDPRVVAYDRAAGRIVSGCVSLGLLTGLLVTLASAGAPAWGWLAGTVAWLVATAALFRWSERWPALSYRYASYILDDRRIEVRHGVYWRRVIVVPRSRVQHIDVTQGPLQRSYGLATITIFTAGTEHSSVPLAGLAHETALALRDFLLPRPAADGV
jgi:membrane protein YdbS with pleckstrin-like domain